MSHLNFAHVVDFAVSQFGVPVAGLCFLGGAFCKFQKMKTKIDPKFQKPVNKETFAFCVVGLSENGKFRSRCRTPKKKTKKMFLYF